jgi:hypothetical protein
MIPVTRRMGAVNAIHRFEARYKPGLNALAGPVTVYKVTNPMIFRMNIKM